MFEEIAASPDGYWADGLAMYPDRTFVGPAEVDRHTGVMRVIRTFNSPRDQIVSMADDNAWMVWVEASLEPNFDDWTIYSYNRATASIRRIVFAPKPDGLHYPNTGFVFVSISNGMITWSAAESYDSVRRIYLINADGSNLKTLATNAHGPQLVWPWILYVQEPGTTGGRSDLIRRNLVTGAVDIVYPSAGMSYFAFDGGSVAWIMGNNELFILGTIGARPVQLSAGQNLQFLSMNDRLLGWGEQDGSFVYDRKLHVIVQLATLSLFSPVLSAAALDWAFQPNPAASNPFDNYIERELDLRNLPQD